MRELDDENNSWLLLLIGAIFLITGYFFVKFFDVQHILPFVTLIVPNISSQGIETVGRYIFSFTLSILLIGIFIIISGFLERKNRLDSLISKLCSFLEDFIEKSKKLPLWIIAAIFTFASLFIHGYRFAVSDQNIYIPLIKHFINPQLYANDYLFLQPQGEYTFFTDIMGFILGKFNDFEIVFFITYILFSFLLFWSIAKITYSLFNEYEIVFLALLLSAAPLSVAGTATLTYDVYTHPRLMAMAIGLFSLYLFIECRYVLSAGAMAIGFLIHPITIIGPIISLFLYLIFKKDIKSCLTSLFVFLPISSPLIYKFLSNPNDLPVFANTTHLYIVRDLAKKSYLFPFDWSYFCWISLVIFLMLFFYGVFIKKNKSTFTDEDKKSILVVATASLLLFLGVLFVEFIPITLAIQLQLGRNLSFLYWFSIIYFAFGLWAIFKENSYLNKLLGIFVISAFLVGLTRVLIGAIVLFAVGMYFAHHISPFLKHKVIKISLIVIFLIGSFSMVMASVAISPVDFPHTYPSNYNEETGSWIDLQLRAKQNTPINSQFLVPPDVSPTFRVFSERGIIFASKDSAPVVFNYEYAKEWCQRWNDLKNYDNLTEEELENAANKYNASYIVVKSVKTLNMPLIYQNKNFKVYKHNLPVQKIVKEGI